jgi:cysteine desulfurase
MGSGPIYLDYNATTPIDPAVVEAMLPYLREHHGNPSSTHSYGKLTHQAVEEARQQCADLIGAKTEEIVFTSGGSEASNLALKGAIFHRVGRGLLEGALSGLFKRGRSTHIVTSAIEHPATAATCAFLRRLGCRITVVGVNREGLVDPDDVRKAIAKPTTLVSIMHSNNEVGTLQPIREIAALCKARNVLLHTDAAQSLGKVATDVNELGVHLLSVAGHKLYAPKGIGLLYVRKGVQLEPLIHGAGHEGGLRAGTENVPYIVALGKACEIARQSLPQATQRLRLMRDRLWEGLRSKLGDRIALNGHPERRLPNTLNVSFAGCIGAELLERTPSVAASTGSACHEGKISQSPVLCAMGVRPELGRGAVRLTVGRFTTEDEIDRAADALIKSNRTLSGFQQA